MRYRALACDYDGTLATDGAVDEPTVRALLGLRASGRRLVLVTGREMRDLQRVFPRLDLFDRVVGENGALIYRPAGRETRVLAERPPARFAETLRAKGVTPLSVGEVVVATWRPHETVVMEVIRALGLELQVIFNKEAVMILPVGITKATGLVAALEELRLSPRNVVAVGDAENDLALLEYCERGVAVANALPVVKERADWVTEGARGAGVTQLIERLVASDLSDLEPGRARRACRL